MNHLTRIAKSTYAYYDSKLEDAKNNIRETWKILNEVINKRKNNLSLPSSFNSDGKTITDPMDIADRSVLEIFYQYWPQTSKPFALSLVARIILQSS